MNLRRIEAESYREALKKVRSAYGDDALIVGTRTLQRGGVLGLGGRQVVEVYVSENRKPQDGLSKKEGSPMNRQQGGKPYAGLSNALKSSIERRPSSFQQEGGTDGPQARRYNGTMIQGCQPAEQGNGSGRAATPQTAQRFPYHAGGSETYGPVDGVRGIQTFAPPEEERENPRINKRLNEIGESLQLLQEEVRHLLRKSEGPPWGHAVLEETYTLLREKDVEEDIAREIVSRLDRQVLPEKEMEPHALRGLLSAHTARYIQEKWGDNVPEDSRVEIFIGPTGVGKTTTIAKLAARARYTYGRKVALVTLDTFRIAAVDQLRKYADIIGLDLKVVTDPAGLESILSDFREYDKVLVDTAGRSPTDEMRLGELESFVRVVSDASVNLVLSVTSTPRSIKHSIDRFSRIGFHHLILTKLDETPGLGVILSVVDAAGRHVRFVTNGQNVPDDIENVDSQRLADLIFREDVYGSS